MNDYTAQSPTTATYSPVAGPVEAALNGRSEPRGEESTGWQPSWIAWYNSAAGAKAACFNGRYADPANVACQSGASMRYRLVRDDKGAIQPPHPDHGAFQRTGLACSIATRTIILDGDEAGKWGDDPVGKLLGPWEDCATSVRDLPGGGHKFHVVLIVPAELAIPELWPRQVPAEAGWGHVKSNGFSYHTGVCSDGSEYRATGRPWITATQELMAAIVASVGGKLSAGGADADVADADDILASWTSPDEAYYSGLRDLVLYPWVPDRREPSLTERCGIIKAAGERGMTGMGRLWDELLASFAESGSASGDGAVHRALGRCKPAHRKVDCALGWAQHVPAGLDAGKFRLAPPVAEGSLNGQGATGAGAAEGVPRFRPRFDLASQAIAAEKLRMTLGTGPLSCLYLRDGQLAHTPRTGEDGYIPPTPREKARGIDHGPAQVRPVSQDQLRSLVEVSFDCGKAVTSKDKETGQVTETWVQSLFPPDPARHAVSAAEMGMGVPGLRHLSGVTHTPILRADGTVLEAPGYDPETGLLYLPLDGLDVPPVPSEPSADEVRKAAGLIGEPVALFPFVASHHRANWLGVMMTPLIRELVPPPYQMAAVTATAMGSGKTLLVKMPGIVHGVVMRGEFPRDRDELRKMFISTLHTTTAPIVAMDNVRGTVYSSELESLLTMRVLSDRELGATRIITVTNDRLWIATGNNMRLGGDMQRRTLPIALDAGVAEPWKRKFPFSPAAWMTAHRAQYLHALLIIARGWSAAGMPRLDPGRSDDYEDWYRTVGGMLAWAGIDGQFGADSPEDSAMVAGESGEWGAFVHAVYQAMGRRLFTARDVVERLRYLEGRQGAISPDTLPDDLADKWDKARLGATSGFGRSLGKWMGYRDGRFTADGLAIAMEPTSSHNAQRYRVTLNNSYALSPSDWMAGLGEPV